MEAKRKIAMIVTKSSFAESEENDIAYYASIGWEESAGNVEKLRQMIWNDEYHSEKSSRVIIANLKEERDDFK